MRSPFWRGYARGTALAWLLALPVWVTVTSVLLVQHHAYPWLIAVSVVAVSVVYMCVNILREVG